MTPMNDAHSQLVDKLNRLSVLKHHDAYADIDWDAPEMRIDADDACWELGDEHPLGASPWYRALPTAERRRLGLQTIASSLKTGVEFEGVLKRGLLEIALGLPLEAPEQRYAYHELIEEAQHSLMFTELLRRLRAASPTPLSLRGLPRHLKPLRDAVVVIARLFPELFFVFVLGGEEPIDFVQRRALAAQRPVHPLLRRIMQIHVTEEARHVAFARSYLRERVPGLSPTRKEVIAVLAPVILAVMARLMLAPPAVARHAEGKLLRLRRVVESVARVRDVLEELGLVRPGLWRRLGVA